jgi:hypothetical protein
MDTTPMGDVERPDRLDELTILDRRRQIAALYLARQTQTAIAQKLGVSQQLVSLDLASLREDWKAEHRQDIDAIITREAAELDAMESQTAVKFATTGEVEWLNSRLRIKQRRAALLGLDQPARIDATSAGQSLGGGRVTEALLIALAPFPEAREAAAAALLELEAVDEST